MNMNVIISMKIWNHRCMKFSRTIFMPSSQYVSMTSYVPYLSVFSTVCTMLGFPGTELKMIDDFPKPLSGMQYSFPSSSDDMKVFNIGNSSQTNLHHNLQSWYPTFKVQWDPTKDFASFSGTPKIKQIVQRRLDHLYDIEKLLMQSKMNL